MSSKLGACQRMKSVDRLDDKILQNLSNSVELLVNLYGSWKLMSDSDKLHFIDLLLVELKIERKNEKLMAYIKEEPLFQWIRVFNN